MEIDPLLFSKAAFPSLKTGITAACFHRMEKICCGELRLKINLKTCIKIFEQLFIINTGMPSNPPDFDGCTH